MIKEEKEWALASGARLYACEWRPEQTEHIRGFVGLVHGMGEHAGRYEHVARMLTEAGYVVWGFDQFGHGRTEGRRGHVARYEDLLAGPDRLVAEARTRYPGVPVFLYGHSMGGNVTINYLLRRQPELAGAIVTSPWLKLAFDPPPATVFLGRMMERVYPQFSNHRPQAVERLTSDPEMARLIAEDPLGHGYITAGFFFGVRRAGEWALQNAGRLRTPLLLMHGDSDKVTSFAASRAFARQAGPLCTFREWPGYRHELHNESGREAVFAVVRDWLDRHARVPTSP